MVFNQSCNSHNSVTFFRWHFFRHFYKFTKFWCGHFWRMYRAQNRHQKKMQKTTDSLNFDEFVSCPGLARPGLRRIWMILCYLILYYTTLYYIMLYYTILYHIISYYRILYYIILYYIILYRIISYYIILYYIML